MVVKDVDVDTGLSVSLVESARNDGDSRIHNEVVVPMKARRFTAQYKLKVLQETKDLEPNERGAYLRKKGLYSSHLWRWRKQAEEGLLGAFGSKKPGRKVTRDYKEEQILQLQKEVQKLKGKLKQAETIIDVQKKLSEVLGLQMPDIAEMNK